MLLCWLALLLVLLVTETGEGWDRVRDELDRIHRVERSFSRSSAGEQAVKLDVAVLEEACLR